MKIMNKKLKNQDVFTNTVSVNTVKSHLRRQKMGSVRLLTVCNSKRHHQKINVTLVCLVDTPLSWMRKTDV